MKVAGRLGLCVCCALLAMLDPAAQRSDVAPVLANHRIWGVAFPTALRQMRGWATIGETEVVVYRDRVLGSHEFERLDGEHASDVLTRTIRMDESSVTPALDRWWGALARESCHVSVSPRPRRDRVVLETFAPDCEFIGQGLTIDAVSALLGPPESVRRRVINGGDDRTQVLTLYGYGDGAVAFVESNFSYRVGRRAAIESAIVDPGRIVRAMAMVSR